jgi:hypothetical protein
MTELEFRFPEYLSSQRHTTKFGFIWVLRSFVLSRRHQSEHFLAARGIGDSEQQNRRYEIRFHARGVCKLARICDTFSLLTRIIHGFVGWVA